MSLKGFKIKITNDRIIKENNLNANAYYTVTGMDNEGFHIELENGMQIEVPEDDAKMVSEQKIING